MYFCVPKVPKALGGQIPPKPPKLLRGLPPPKNPRARRKYSTLNSNLFYHFISKIKEKISFLIEYSAYLYDKIKKRSDLF